MHKRRMIGKLSAGATRTAIPNSARFAIRTVGVELKHALSDGRPLAWQNGM